MIADINIHNPKASDGLDQPHAHVTLTMRDIGPDGFGNKRRDWNDFDFGNKRPTGARVSRQLSDTIDTAVTASRLPASARPMLDAALRHVLTPRAAAWTGLRRAKRRTVESPALLADVREHSSTLNQAIEPAEAFIARVRGREAAQLDD